jgi:DNA-binding response OmpR family regulator
MDKSQPGSTSARARVLVVDDERDIAEMVSDYIGRAGYLTSEAYTGPDAVTAARDFDPDVIMLDLGLPGFDGVEVCRQVRMFSDCYILMLTARADEVARVVGLSVGADDYITKPVSTNEVLARIQAVLRRPRRTQPHIRQSGVEEPARLFGDLRIEAPGREVTLAGKSVPLTRTEFDLLEALSARPKQVFTRRQLIDEVWDTGWMGDEHVVDVHIGHIRGKLGDDANSAKYIETIRSVGYRMGKG